MVVIDSAFGWSRALCALPHRRSVRGVNVVVALSCFVVVARGSYYFCYCC